ncbi:MAG: hypothetical protein AB1331_09905 [Bacillota bacterium]
MLCEYRYLLVAILCAIIYLAINWRMALQAEKAAREKFEADGPWLMELVIDEACTKLVLLLPTWLRAYLTRQRLSRFA